MRFFQLNIVLSNVMASREIQEIIDSLKDTLQDGPYLELSNAAMGIFKENKLCYKIGRQYEQLLDMTGKMSPTIICTDVCGNLHVGYQHDDFSEEDCDYKCSVQLDVLNSNVIYKATITFERDLSTIVFPTKHEVTLPMTYYFSDEDLYEQICKNLTFGQIYVPSVLSEQTFRV